MNNIIKIYYYIIMVTKIVKRTAKQMENDSIKYGAEFLMGEKQQQDADETSGGSFKSMARRIGRKTGISKAVTKTKTQIKKEIADTKRRVKQEIAENKRIVKQQIIDAKLIAKKRLSENEEIDGDGLFKKLKRSARKTTSNIKKSVVKKANQFDSDIKSKNTQRVVGRYARRQGKEGLKYVAREGISTVIDSGLGTMGIPPGLVRWLRTKLCSFQEQIKK
jgi:hypothetical protein